jgi:hypothetical protein
VGVADNTRRIAAKIMLVVRADAGI